MRIVLDARPLAKIKHNAAVFAAAKGDVVAIGWFMETQTINGDFHLVLFAEKSLFFQHPAASSEIPAILVFLVHEPM